MTEITDAIIDALHNLGYGVHFITSKDPSEDRYARSLGYGQGPGVTPARGKVLHGRSSNVSDQQEPNGVVVIDPFDTNDNEVEYVLGHEGIHTRDNSAPSYGKLGVGTGPQDPLTDTAEKLTDLRACLMLPEHIAHADYLTLIDALAFDLTFRKSTDEEKQELLSRAQHYGGIENLPAVFEGLAGELQPYADPLDQLLQTQQQKLIDLNTSRRRKISIFGDRMYDRRISQQRREYNALEAEMWNQMPQYLKLLTGFENLGLGRPPIVKLFKDLQTVKVMEGELQTLDIPLIYSQKK